MAPPSPLGRHVEHDERSRLYPAFKARASERLRVTEWRHHGPVLNQGDLGSCTGNALAQALNCAPFYKPRPWWAPWRKTRRLLNENDAVKIYELATRLDSFPGEWPPEDTGSSGLAACKAAVSLAWITGYRHAFGFDEALRALMFSPFIVGTNWYDSMTYPASGTVVGITSTATVLGGHEYLVVGMDPQRKLIHCINSWGTNWGKRGHFWMHFKTFERLLSEQGDVTVPVL